MNTNITKMPKLILGGIHSDERGILSFVNDFDLSPAKRFYLISHPNKEVIRAWQGHQQEFRYFHVLKGSFIVAWVKIDNWEAPSISLKAEHAILTAIKPAILSIPPGYANGLKALEPDSQILVFSDHTINETNDDKYRYNKDLWFDWEKLQ